MALEVKISQKPLVKILIFELSVDTVLSIKFCRNKAAVRTALWIRYEFAKSTSDAYWTSAKNEDAF